MCSTSTGQSCWPCADCNSAPAPPRAHNRDRVLNERLLTIEWKQRTLPDVEHVGPESCLLISTSATADVMATSLTDALKAEGAGCVTMTWPQHSDHQANAELLGSHLGAREVSGVVILTGPGNGNPDEECALRGGDYVRHLVRIVRQITEIDEAPPRLYVVTRNAQTVLPGDVNNLEQAGLRGLIRAISTEYPHLRATQIDMDEDTGRRATGTATAGDVGGGRDGLAERSVAHGAPEPRTATP